MKADLRALLTGAPPVKALAPGGINWGTHPQGVVGPYIVLTQVSMTQDYGINGRLLPNRYRVQVDCYAGNALDAENLSRAVLSSLDGHKDEPFLGIFLISAGDYREDEENAPIHRVSMDFNVVYRG